MTKKFAFWPYDMFPYVLGDEIVGEIRYGADGKPIAKTKGYGGGNVHPISIIEGDNGEEAVRKLRALAEESRKAHVELTNEFMAKALDIAPFLTSFPGYGNRSTK